MSSTPRSIATLIWLTVLSVAASAAEPGIWDCQTKFALCRYLDAQTREEIIPPRFDRAMPFSEGLAAVSISGRFGYVDERGNVVIEPRFDLGGDFIHGLAEVVIDKKAGVINNKGEIIVQPMFNRAIPLTNEVIVATEGAWVSGYYEGFEKLPSLAESILSRAAGLYHVNGYWIRKPELRNVRALDKEGGSLIWVSERSNNDDLYGLMSASGEWIVPPQYIHVQQISDDYAIVRKRVDGVLLSGAIDRTGQLVVPLQPRSLSYWRNGWGIAREDNKQDSKQALIDRDGNIIGGRYFDKVERGEKGDIAKVLIDGRWVGMDRAGNIVPNPDNGRVVKSCAGGMQLISMDGKLQIADATGRPTTAYLFDDTAPKPNCRDPLSIRYNGLYSFIAVDGRLMVDPPRFKDVSGFNDGYAAVFDGQKWGIIDASGDVVLSPKYDKYLNRRDGLFYVEIDGRKIWINPKGEEQPEPPVKRPPPSELLGCGEALRLIERDGLWGIADADGTDVIAPRYRAVTCFKNGVAWVAIDERRQWCALGFDAKICDYPACKTQHHPISMPHSYPEKLDDDRYESSVLWSRAYLEFLVGRRDKPPEWIRMGRARDFTSTVNDSVARWIAAYDRSACRSNAQRLTVHPCRLHGTCHVAGIRSRDLDCGWPSRHGHRLSLSHPHGCDPTVRRKLVRLVTDRVDRQPAHGSGCDRRRPVHRRT